MSDWTRTEFSDELWVCSGQGDDAAAFICCHSNQSSLPCTPLTSSTTLSDRQEAEYSQSPILERPKRFLWISGGTKVNIVFILGEDVEVDRPNTTFWRSSAPSTCTTKHYVSSTSMLLQVQYSLLQSTGALEPMTLTNWLRRLALCWGLLWRHQAGFGEEDVSHPFKYHGQHLAPPLWADGLTAQQCLTYAAPLSKMMLQDVIHVSCHHSVRWLPSMAPPQLPS